MSTLEEIASSTKRNVYSHMLETRRHKFKWMLAGLKSFKLVNLLFTEPSITSYKNALNRAELLESYYVLMRYIDDIVDGDAELSPEFGDTEEFVKRKIEFSHSSKYKKPEDDIERLIIYCFNLAQQCGFEISDETDDLLNSMLFDAERINYTRRYHRNRMFTDSELKHHFYLLDIRGTIRCSLKIFGENPDKFPLLQHLGEASRIYYNLKDIKQDLTVGIINVPREHCERPEFLESRDYMRRLRLKDEIPFNVALWMKQEAVNGKLLLEKHNESMRHCDYSNLVRITLPVMYQWPASRYFSHFP